MKAHISFEYHKVLTVSHFLREGFFISNSGHFITANHVIEGLNDFSKVIFTQPSALPYNGAFIQHIELIQKWPKFDLALLKADFEFNTKDGKEFFQDLEAFTYLEIDFEDQTEGTPVYAFGFPLSKVNKKDLDKVKLAFEIFSPRTTSAIIASRYSYIGWARGSGDAKFYAIDRTLDFGNSGGPIILSETGNVFAVCIEFQPTIIRQPQISPDMIIKIPANYGIISSLSNIKNYLTETILP